MNPNSASPRDPRALTREALSRATARLKTYKIPNFKRNLSNHEIECIISRWILITIP